MQRVVPKWIYNGTMAKTVTLSVKNVPADLAKRLKERAQKNNRSLQGELLTILEDAGHAQLSLSDIAAGHGQLSLSDIAALAKKLGIKSDKNESTQWIREDRDARSR